MVKIFVTESVAGADYAYGRGEQVVSYEVAKDLVRGNHAEYLEVQDDSTKSKSKKTSEKASAGSGETATQE